MIGILTFHWADDYGAMLQAYALKHYIEKSQGDKVKIIPYAPIKFTGRYWLCPVVARQDAGKLKYCFALYAFKRNLSNLFCFLKRRKNMRRFRHVFLTSEPVIRRVDRISLEKYSCVFVGSDQVWNPEITFGLDDAYIGKIKKNGNCKFVSYGASFGGNMISDKYLLDLKTAVNRNFTAISLREISAVPLLGKILNRNITDVLDPTLLLDRKEWERLGKLPDKRGYILFIYTEYNEQMVQYLHELSIELQRKVIQLSVPWPGQKENWIDIKMDGGPSEFIGYFKNASYVVTNSFHGMVFSVLLEKQFIVFSHSSKNARIEDFLKKIHLDIRLIRAGKILTKELMMSKIDWKYVKQLLEREKELSFKFIQENCKGIK